jgi:hypothetical protein
MSSADPVKLVVVDDTNLGRLQYAGQWKLDHGSLNGDGVYGPEYNNTLHGTNGNDTSITFAFNGEFFPR